MVCMKLKADFGMLYFDFPDANSDGNCFIFKAVLLVHNVVCLRFRRTRGSVPE